VLNKTNKELYQERKKRIEDAIAMRTPDRVPIFIDSGLFPARYAGLPLSSAFSDDDAWSLANERFVLDFAPDMHCSGSFSNTPSGKASMILGVQQWKYPGYGLDENMVFQFVEGEYMKPEEYDHFLDDPSDFLLRVYLPRINGGLEGLRSLPQLKYLVFGALDYISLLSVPSITALITRLNEAALVASRKVSRDIDLIKRLADQGYPAFCESVTMAPFDVVSDYFRGMSGAMLDMYRRPEKLLAAQEKLLPMLIESAIAAAKNSTNPRVFIPMHRGSDGFMSLKQFEEFYWPGLKRLMITLVDAGLIPVPLFEGSYDHRLEYLRELPDGKVLCWFESTNLSKAKEIIGDKLCIAGNISHSLLQFGTVEQVKEATKKLIDTVGKGGGYIMANTASLDDVSPELVRVWIDYTKEYGVYS
jgi:hypothetical protein